MSDSPGETLHRYRLDERIGTGGMAQVFRATALGAEGFEKAVAIKRILPGLAGDGFQQRFVNEAKLTATLTHANIVQIIDFGRVDGVLFIAMEYVDGLDLHGLLKSFRDERLRPEAALYIAMATCRGLEFAHSQGVIHRDISPSNILLSKAGAVKVADFGIARAADSSLTAPRQILGKFSYMSPEQTRGDELDLTSDVFSAGIVFYELMSSRPLFAEPDIEDVIDAIHNRPIQPLSELRRDCPEGYDAVIARMLERDPKARYQRLRDVEQDLMAVCLRAGWMPSENDVASAVAEALEANSDRARAVRQLLPQAATGLARRRTDSATAPESEEIDVYEVPTGSTLIIPVPAASSDKTTLALWALQSATAETATDLPPSLPVISDQASRQRVRSIVAGVAVAIGAIVIALWMVKASGARDGAEVTRGEVADAAPGTPAVVAGDAAIIPPPVAPMDAAPTDALPVVVDASAPDRSATRSKSAKKTNRRVPAPPAKARHQVQISAVPWAHVYLGSKRIGTSPSQRRFALPEGRHVLTLRNPELGVSKRVRVTAPSPTVYRFDLRAR